MVSTVVSKTASPGSNPGEPASNFGELAPCLLLLFRSGFAAVCKVKILPAKGLLGRAG